MLEKKQQKGTLLQTRRGRTKLPSLRFRGSFLREESLVSQFDCFLPLEQDVSCA